jgi:hypothetical protein
MSDLVGAPVANNGGATELYGTFGQSKRYRATGSYLRSYFQGLKNDHNKGGVEQVLRDD